MLSLKMSAYRMFVIQNVNIKYLLIELFFWIFISCHAFI